MNSNQRLATVALLLSVVFFCLQYLSIQPPQAKGLDAPANEFSAARAYGLLETLLQENNLTQWGRLSIERSSGG